MLLTILTKFNDFCEIYGQLCNIKYNKAKVKTVFMSYLDI